MGGMVFGALLRADERRVFAWPDFFRSELKARYGVAHAARNALSRQAAPPPFHSPPETP